ncbi:MAG: acyl--CoA ligase [Desulfobacteraceae bacterium]|nr:acyl--CoA ligase [Desulfobacteraceae bacterium]
MITISEDQIKEYKEKGWWGDQTLMDLFLKNAKAMPDSVALTDPPNRSKFTSGESVRLTYHELLTVVENLAAGLLRIGIRKDDIVMLQLPNITELACAYLAISRIGAIATPLSVMHRTHELLHAMRMSDPKAYITTTNFKGFDFVDMVQNAGVQEKFPGLKTIISVSESKHPGVVSYQDLLGENGSTGRLPQYLAETSISADDVFSICWTSGTEADPKGVPRSSNQWIAAGHFVREAGGVGPFSNILSPFPFINMGSIVVFIQWLLTGGKLCLHHPFDIPVFLEQVKQEKINYTVLPPAILNTLLQNKQVLETIDLTTVKTIGSGSAPLADWMVRGFQEKGIDILNIFGSNEGLCLISGPTDFPNPDDRAKYFPAWGAEGVQGKIPSATRMKTKLIDTYGNRIKEKGNPGEMCVKGPAVFAGYYKRPDLNDKSFDEEGYFKTGDRFSLENNGAQEDRYLFIGRTKDLIIRGGNNIAPEELENLIIGHPKILEAAVVGYPDIKLGERVCAVVVLAENETMTLDELNSFLIKKGLAIYKRPEKFLPVKFLPRNALGKILKRELRTMFKENS